MLTLQRASAALTCSTSSRRNFMHTAMHTRQPMRLRAALTAEKADLDIQKMEPLNDRLLIKPMEDEERTEGGILLPKGPPKANSEAHIGEVIAVGSDVTIKVSAGDKVVFNKYAMAEVEVADGNILFVAEKSILATLE